MVGPLTMKRGTFIYHNKSSSKQKLKFVNNNKQPQANGVSAYNWLMNDGSSHNET